jgi:hypothetical protein
MKRRRALTHSVLTQWEAIWYTCSRTK